jgi:hypothetical protein
MTVKSTVIDGSCGVGVLGLEDDVPLIVASGK